MIITEEQLKEFAIKNGFNYDFDGKLNMSFVAVPDEFNLFFIFLFKWFYQFHKIQKANNHLFSFA